MNTMPPTLKLADAARVPLMLSELRLAVSRPLQAARPCLVTSAVTRLYRAGLV